MPIHGMTDRGLSFPQIGTIRKGSPKQKKERGDGSTYEIQGKDLTHFRVEFDDTETVASELFKKLYGDQPNMLKVTFPFNEIDRVWDAWLEAYTSSRLIARSDGEKIIYWKQGKVTYVKNGLATGDYTVNIWKKIEGIQTEPLVVTMKADQPVPFIEGMVFHRTEKTIVEAKPVGRLRVTLYELKRLGYMLLPTTSMNDIISLGGPDSGELGAIRAFSSSLGLPFAGIPLILRRKPKDITYTDASGKQNRMKRWLVHIEADPEFVALALQKSRELATPAVALLQHKISSTELSGVNEPELIEDEEENIPSPDMDNVEEGEVKEDTPKAEETKVEEPKDEPVFGFNHGNIVIAVAKVLGYDNNTAYQTVREAHDKGRIPEKLTVSQAKKFAEGLLK